MLLAAGIWVGITVPVQVLGALLIAGLVMWRRRGTLIVFALLAGLAVGLAEEGRATATITAAVPAGVVEIEGTALSDVRTAGSGRTVLVRPQLVTRRGAAATWQGPVLLVRGAVPEVAAGESIVVRGTIDPEVDSHRGRPVGGALEAFSGRRLGPAANPVVALGNRLRARILAELDDATDRPGGALVLGFLIGDVSRLPTGDSEALRQAGLSHYVAVSGSNVAIFLAAWWLVGGPLALGPRRRALFGLVGLAVFTVVTRWEPSVVRASLMAGLVLVGRLAGSPLSPWTALGGAVAISLLVAPGLTGSVGFALSVAATAGIIAATSLWRDRRPRAAWAILGATISAQVAVAPLLIAWFGSVPLVAPLTNLLAAPLVAAATILGGVGAGVGWSVPVDLASRLGAIVLAIARTSNDLPQLGVAGLLGVAVASVAAWRVPSVRPLTLAASAALVAMAVMPRRLPVVPVVTFLDVGQGDATLFEDPSGAVMLVDGGPDPLRLGRLLGERRIERIDLMVASHRHADHVGGLIGLTDSTPVGALWVPDQLGESPLLDLLVAEARAAGVPVATPRPGDSAMLGGLLVEVVGPARRYAGPNDMSLVLLVRSGTLTVVMPGDIEVAAQRDLGPLRGEILKVPHQGGATSDLDWLAASAPRIAVVSVGPNSFGHPSEVVIDTLVSTGSTVFRTDRDGSIRLELAAIAAAVG